MKTVCVYHSVDLDGWMSAAIVKHWFNQQEVPNKEGEYCNTIDFIGYTYGQPIPDLSEYDKVIMVDISFPKEEMEKLFNRNTKDEKNVIWIDHHISALRELHTPGVNYFIHGLLDTKLAACELAWSYFFPNEQMPEIVRLLGRYDCFGHKGTSEETEVLEFQYGARSVIYSMESAYASLCFCLVDIKEGNGQDLVGANYTRSIYRSGIAIYQYLCQEAKQTYKNGFPLNFMYPDTGVDTRTIVKGICINKERFNPVNFGIDYHKDGYDIVWSFHYANGKWNFSIYNDNGLVDCSEIAKCYGGGGHKGAAGFIIDDISKMGF